MAPHAAVPHANVLVLQIGAVRFLYVIAIVLGYLVSGVVIVEAVFSYPGLGRLILDSVGFRDMPMVQALAMIFCAFYIGVNLLADVIVLLTNPRLREQQ